MIYPCYRCKTKYWPVCDNSNWYNLYFQLQDELRLPASFRRTCIQILCQKERAVEEKQLVSHEMLSGMSHTLHQFQVCQDVLSVTLDKGTRSLLHRKSSQIYRRLSSMQKSFSQLSTMDLPPLPIFLDAVAPSNKTLPGYFDSLDGENSLLPSDTEDSSDEPSAYEVSDDDF